MIQKDVMQLNFGIRLQTQTRLIGIEGLNVTNAVLGEF